MAAFRASKCCAFFARKTILSQSGCCSQFTKRTIVLSQRISDQNKDEPNGVQEFVIPKRQRNETASQQRARLTYQSRKRGVSENGLLLSTFVAQNMAAWDQTLLDQYDELINGPSNDWDLYYWMTNVKETPSQYDTPLMESLKTHVANTNREKRFYQPALN